MPTTITIRQVPDQVRNELAARAAGSGRSLQEFMLGELTRMAEKPPLEALLVEIRERKAAGGVRIDRAELLADRAVDKR